MGNCNYSSHNQIGNISQWEQVNRNTFSCTLKHPQQIFLIQKWTSLEIENPNIYTWRMKNQEKSLPQIRQIGQEVLPIYCYSKKNETAKGSVLVTDAYIPLANVSNLTSGECALLIKIVLPGLKLLCEKFGWFAITNQNVFIDYNGQSAIWIHPNLAVNKPRTPINNKESSQQKIIRNLFQVVKNKMGRKQSLQIDIDGLDFKKSEIILKEYLKNKFPNLNKIYVDRARYERQQYQISSYKGKQLKQSDSFSKNTRILTRTQSTNPSQILNFKARMFHPSFTSTIGISKASQINQEIVKNEKAQYSTENQVKDPDELLLELIQQYKLNQQ